MTVHVELARVASEVVVGAAAVPAAAVVSAELAVRLVSASELVLSVIVAVPVAVVFVTGEIVNCVVVLAGTEQELPARVIVTMLLEFVPLALPTAVAVQLVKPVVRPIVGEAGTAKPAGKVATIVEPARSAPVELVV